MKAFSRETEPRGIKDLAHLGFVFFGIDFSHLGFHGL